MADERFFPLVGHFLFIHSKFLFREELKTQTLGDQRKKAHFIQAEKP